MSSSHALRPRHLRNMAILAWTVVLFAAAGSAHASSVGGGLCGALKQVLAAAPDHFESLVDWPAASFGEGATNWRDSHPDGDHHMATIPKLRLPIDYGLAQIVHIQSSRPSGTFEPGVTLYMVEVRLPDTDEVGHRQRYKTLSTQLAGCLGAGWTRSKLTVSAHRSHLEGLELREGQRFTNPRQKDRLEVRLEAAGDYIFVGVYVITPPDPTRILTSRTPATPVAVAPHPGGKTDGEAVIGGGFCDALNRALAASSGGFASLKGRDVSNSTSERYESTLTIPGARSTVVTNQGIEPGPRLVATFLETRDGPTARSFHSRLTSEIAACNKPCGTLVKGSTEKEWITAIWWLPFGGNEICPPNLKIEALFRPLPLPEVMYLVELNLVLRSK